MIIDQLNNDQAYQLSEYFKCKNDLIYFIEHWAMLPTAGGDDHIKLYDLQKKYLHHILENHHTIICKSRQVGASTMNQFLYAWICTFYENVVIGVVSRSGSESTDFARKVMDILDKLPSWLRPEFTKRTEQSFILKNGCKLYTAAINPSNPSNLLRGKSLHCLTIDECSFIPSIDVGAAAIMPALSKAQKDARERGIPYCTTIISTPNRTTGIGKYYFNMWKDAINGNSIYKPFQMWWKDIPEFADDPNWYKEQCALLGNVKWRIAQELDLQFVASSNSFFDADIISKLNTIDVKPISITTINGHDLKHFAVPDKNRFYLIGIDTASNYGTDSSTIWVMDYETGEQVAEFQSKLRVDEFCPIIEQVCKIFPNNLLIPECNSYGNQVCEYLTRKGIYNIYQTKSKNNVIGSSKGSKYRYGLYTNPMNRPLIIDALYTVVSESIECVKSVNTALELVSLIDDGNGKVAADEGEHDDLVMAFAFCCYVRLYDPPKTLLSKTSTKEERETIDDVVNWNNDENGLVNIAPELSKMYDEANEVDDPIKKQQLLNKSYRKFISTNFDRLMEQSADQRLDTPQGSYINLIDIMNGKRNTSYF